MQDKVVLVTGGTGSFGRAFLKDALKRNPKQIRVFSRDELKQSQLKEEFNDPRILWLLGDIRDSERLLTALEGVDVCIHAAAMKRIEACETDPQEAIKTNVNGTVNVINACLKRNVSHAVLISTDKAVYPVNNYGATKLCAEKTWIQSNTYRGKSHPTKFSVVRYGNVIGSRGSVVNIFKEQLKSGVIRITDAGMTRFFITIQEAVDLVQLALETHQGGEIFIPKLKSASIYQIAKLVGGKCSIEVTSQRGGEKLHESLVTLEESKRTASFPHYSVINPEIKTWPYLDWTSDDMASVKDSNLTERYSDKELYDLLGI